MTSIRAEINPACSTPAQQVVNVWAGPASDCLGHRGALTMLGGEAEELIARIAAGESEDDLIKPKMAAHVLWHFREPGGMEPGSFTKALIMVISAADPTSRARLAHAFPGLVYAVRIAQDEEGGITQLQQIARGAR